jgi:hypothetical protein
LTIRKNKKRKHEMNRAQNRDHMQH